MNDERPMEDRLPYSTKPMSFPNGTSVEEFIIPDEDKEIVLAQLYPSSPIPNLTDEIYDLHANRKFIVKDFRVMWEHGMNYLVSPYYPESGGTAIDSMDENSWVDDDFDGEDFDDDESDSTEADDSDKPFPQV